MTGIIYENLDETLQQKIDSGGSGGGITLPISANDITEVPERVFVTPSEKAMINTNSSENASQTTRIATIEQQLNTLSTTDELVKMDVNSEAKYLSELLDDATIKNIDGKLTVEALRGLITTVNELNNISGSTSNIQQQINTLSGVSGFRGVFPSLAELMLAPNPQPGEYAIVSEGGMSSYYFYFENNWDFTNEVSTPTDIDINTGTVGMLAKNRYVHQNASETSFINTTTSLQSTNSQDAIVEVFRFADSLLKGLTQTVGIPLSQTDSIDTNLRNFKIWYANIAEAITLKGVNTSSSNNGNEIIQKIKAIPNISIDGVVKKKSKLNVAAGSNIEVQLSSAIALTDITSTLIEFVAGATGIIAYNLEFNNGDSSNFEPNEYIVFDGKMKLKKEYILTPIRDTSFLDGFLDTVQIDTSAYSSVEGIL